MKWSGVDEAARFAQIGRAWRTSIDESVEELPRTRISIDVGGVEERRAGF